jgi:hypothetical protein
MQINAQKRNTIYFINTFIVHFFVTQPRIIQSLQISLKANSGMMNLKRLLGVLRIKESQVVSQHTRNIFTGCLVF